MTNDLPENNQKEIKELQQGFAVMNVKVDHITQNLHEIKNNHLLHINDELGSINSIISQNQTIMTELVTNKMAEAYSKISELRITDAKQEPGNNLFNKIIEYAILGLIGIGIAYISSK